MGKLFSRLFTLSGYQVESLEANEWQRNHPLFLRMREWS